MNNFHFVALALFYNTDACEIIAYVGVVSLTKWGDAIILPSLREKKEGDFFVWLK